MEAPADWLLKKAGMAGMLTGAPTTYWITLAAENDTPAHTLQTLQDQTLNHAPNLTTLHVEEVACQLRRQIMVSHIKGMVELVHLVENPRRHGSIHSAQADFCLLSTLLSVN